jgi:hypothetical protein
VDWLYLSALAGFPLGFGLEAVHKLVQNMSNMSTAFGCTDGIDKGTMLKTITIRLCHENFPTLSKMCMNISVSRMEERSIILEILNW